MSNALFEPIISSISWKCHHFAFPKVDCNFALFSLNPLYLFVSTFLGSIKFQ